MHSHKSLLFLIAFALGSLSGMGQRVVPPSRWNDSLAGKTEAEIDLAMGIRHDQARILTRNCLLNKKVYGWHPAWMGTAYLRYDFGLLSTVAYHGYQIDPATGKPERLYNWRETGLVEAAHDGGAQVELSAFLHATAGVTKLLQSATARKTLADSLVALVKLRDADGVCLDLMGVGPRLRDGYAALVKELHDQLQTWRKDATLSIALYPDAANSGVCNPAIVPMVTRFILMGDPGQDPRSDKAGPVSPIHASAKWGQSALDSSISRTIAAGIPKAKLIVALPYYGYEWPTASAEPGAKATGKPRLVTLRDYELMDSSAFLQWDSSSATGWLLHEGKSGYRQLWMDQVSSLTDRMSLVMRMDLGGVAIASLGYDHGSDKYWNLIQAKFADCGAAKTEEHAKDAKPQIVGLEGPTSAERNTWNWVWMLAGGIFAVGVILLVKKYL
ncbi:MAG: glycosyl hydrolase family 18 protein [Bacteroidia bacterium]